MSSGTRDRGWIIVAHHHPGRLRVRSPRFEVDGRLLETTHRWLMEHPGVRSAACDPTAGSILVVYDPSHADPGDLLVAIATRTRLVVVEREPRVPAARRIFQAARAIDGFVLDASGGLFGLGVAFPAAMGLGSIASFVMSAHDRTPRWDNLLWWGMQAFRAFNEEHRPPPARHHANGN